MCAVAGVLMLEGPLESEAHAEELRAAVRGMNLAQAHRGPDDDTLWSQGPMVLGHRRLSIIDLEGGRQPLASEDGAVQVICNGEIYNHRELRAELCARGHRFRTRSDVEVIVHAYEEWGTMLLRRLSGMYGLAIYDARQRQLLLARDPVGEKPLYYHLGTHRGARLLSFASEAKGVLALPWVERRVDPAGLSDYLRYRYIAAPRTALVGLRKLPAGTYLRVPVGHSGPLPEPTAFWELRYRPKLRGRRLQVLQQVEEAVAEAVRSRLMADVPVGVLISGGIDSSLVLGLMRRHLGPQPLLSFCAGFSDEQHDERPLAAAVAHALGTIHHSCVVDHAALDLLPRLLYHLDEPLGDPSIMPTYHVAALAAQHVKVVLTGDGGDEGFAGYDRYRRSRLSDLLRALPHRPHGLLRRAVTLLGTRLPWLLPPPVQQRILDRLHTSQQAAEEPLGRLFERSVTAFCPAEVRALLGPAGAAEAHQALATEQVAEWFDSADAEHYLDRFLHSDLRTYLADNLMVKSDRMTMAHGLEARAPLLDVGLLELAARLPVRYKRRPGSQGKIALRALARRVLPPLVAAQVTGQGKRGFTPPLASWLAAHWSTLEPLLARSSLVEAGLVEASAWAAARGPGERSVERRFLLVLLELWHRVVILGQRDLALPQRAAA
ncbi:MAG: asparagine synthase (glutamine-hydrolyzing) [Myxococcales bacterium]|nr:asparagine synthase (glutamine-hydrolyzing) [Myxococcota bacterium]MDW8281237.1 asparagine synthase (glutamine-hydrolyzing) [Myxococcales bacterium]